MTETPITLVWIAESTLQESSSQYNVNNLWTNGQRPTDYEDVNKSCQTKHWVDLLRTSYSVFLIQPGDVAWIRNAARVGAVTGVPPTSTSEERADLVQRRGLEWAAIGQTGSFVRSETCSLKGGYHGVGPYNSLLEVAESLCTPRIGHDPLDDVDPKVGLKLYRWAWETLDRQLEVRVFVWKGEVVAISQQHIYGNGGNTTDDPSDQTLIGWGRRVVDAWYGKFRPQLQKSVSWDGWVKRGVTLDIGARIGSREPYFIEVNPSGAAYAAGSALYHWQRDKELLHGEKLPLVEVRWCRAGV